MYRIASQMMGQIARLMYRIRWIRQIGASAERFAASCEYHRHEAIFPRSMKGSFYSPAVVFIAILNAVVVIIAIDRPVMGVVTFDLVRDVVEYICQVGTNARVEAIPLCRTIEGD
jgi:hypothetical protein